jgi:Tfp pilus assembly protein PilF
MTRWFPKPCGPARLAFFCAFVLFGQVSLVFAEAASRNSKQKRAAIPDKTERQTPEEQATAANERGLAHLAKGRFTKALAAFDEAIRLMPDQARFYANRATVWGQKRNTEKALEECTKAIAADPDNPQWHVLRGSIFLTGSRWRDAIDDH